MQIKRSDIRKGMVMVSPALNPEAYWEFKGEILVLHHPTTISPRYQAMGDYYFSYLNFYKRNFSFPFSNSNNIQLSLKKAFFFKFLKSPSSVVA